ncbi:hypothetical protein, partial [Burkholderia stagnalis]|uniref:hypothetical protein n=1 Tax=Burkholderia stagnalis TaxID=1503054 RepID=UPI001C89FB6C
CFTRNDSTLESESQPRLTHGIPDTSKSTLPKFLVSSLVSGVMVGLSRRNLSKYSPAHCQVLQRHLIY